ncbi:hypothetical protein FH972_005569 [Carpinus fangiana]|uniref:Uncharacterized protein n=1 Tax=Carpinus fangiana TaxID=176857 RepID=A0A5N6QPN7_9ROSI|nr:hypothetical protein FH972_005569 [Carpinus fangiana]
MQSVAKHHKFTITKQYIWNFLLHKLATNKLLRERAKSKERGRGRRAATSRELRPERERRPASGRESGGQRVGERAAVSE